MGLMKTEAGVVGERADSRSAHYTCEYIHDRAPCDLFLVPEICDNFDKFPWRML